MTTGIYPGSFNPWHQGHWDVLDKALKVFDNVVIAFGKNPDKFDSNQAADRWAAMTEIGAQFEKTECIEFDGLLVDAISDYNIKHPYEEITTVIRGLRNGADLQYEMNQQYWNEDLGLKCPVVYFIADRTVMHYSSSAIRSIERAKAVSHPRA